MRRFRLLIKGTVKLLPKKLTMEQSNILRSDLCSKQRMGGALRVVINIQSGGGSICILSGGGSKELT